MRAEPLSSASFEDEWPELARKLAAMLSAKRIPADKREDIVQETGLRLFRMWDQVDPHRPVWALAVTIALNLVRDEARRGRKREILGAVPDIATPHEDVERAGLARIELGRVERALTQLAPAHRSILLAELGDEIPDQTRGPNAVKMLRMRARRRLTSLLDAAGALGGIVGLRARRLLGLEHHLLQLRTSTSSVESMIGPAAAGLAVAIALWGLGAPLWPGSEPGSTDDDAFVRRSVAVSEWDPAAARTNPSDAGMTRAGAESEGAYGDVGRGRSRQRRNPLRVPVPGHGFVEGEVGIGLLGLGLEVGERDGRPFCLNGDVIPTEVNCSRSRATGTDQGPGGLTVKAYLRIRYGEHTIEVHGNIE